MSNNHVVVIGAGLGGLALAQGLVRAGIDVTVFERDDALTARAQGYRLHLDGRTRDTLQELLSPTLMRVFDATAAVVTPRFTVLNAQLDELTVRPSAPGVVDFAVDRLVLRQILLAGIEDRVHFGKEMREFRLGPDGRPTACFADGSRITGDVLVGADGVNSVVRQRYLPHARVVDTGVRGLHAIVPLTNETRNLFDDYMFGVYTVIAGGAGTHLGIGPMRFPEPPHTVAGALLPGLRLLPVSDYAVCAFGARRERLGLPDDRLRALDGPAMHSIVTDAVRDWHPRLRDIVAHIDPASIFPLIMRSSVPIPAWPTTRVTLLGDAIHAMSPASGVGACTALRDAARLCSALRRAATGRDLITELREYEAEMIDYGFAAVRVGAENGHRFLAQDPLPIAAL
ncbi:FAD-dependent oxidoreductase [Nocardia sp. NPDC052566]|uniref:FAD-dependent oxidoreductase n=1 Tax=Nocardia sp. NPDC052566 TaxID=3364330 RepID=UPI0037C815C2